MDRTVESLQWSVGRHVRGQRQRMAAAVICILLAFFGLASGKNIARGGQVAQSSNYNNETTAEKAVDGNHDSWWDHYSCATTQQDNRPWWRLDLLKRYKNFTVTITNRGDDVPERLDGAEIHIGDSLEDNGNSNPRCTMISSIAAGASQTFKCEGMTGQYVNIVIPNREEILTLCEVEVSGDPADLCPTTNIARGGQVTQSSNFNAATAEKAVDGNRDGEWSHYSCTTTQQDNRPWWRLDLQKRYKIYTVTITNREDAAPERLDGAEIRIGDSLEDNGNSNPRCAEISSIAAGATETFKCEGMMGQYVNIVIPKRYEYLTLCEVEVTGEPAENIARGGQVAQSSNYMAVTTAEKAVDGNHDSWWDHYSCATTQQENRPWWRLDLQKTYKIYTVTITNRRDAVPERLNGAEIHIGDSLEDNGNSNPRCTVISSIAAGASQTFKCEGKKGQYVNIVIPNRQEILTLCEVEVTGDPADLCPDDNIATGGRAIQSSVHLSGVPGRAIDGNINSMWDQGSCTLTLPDHGPWWRLDLLKRYKICTVTIINRGDAFSERLDGAEIRIGDSLEDRGNTNPRCAVIGSMAPGASRIFECNGMKGRYINVVIPNKREYLTLCEVQVTGIEYNEGSQADVCSQG